MRHTAAEREIRSRPSARVVHASSEGSGAWTLAAIAAVVLACALAFTLLMAEGALANTMPHGIFSWSTNMCEECHEPHGAGIPYTDKRVCYRCHGETDSASSTGAGASSNVQAQFGDYGDQSFTSQHRNPTVTANEKDCGLCHTPHRQPSEFPYMLRVETSADSYVYFSELAGADTGNAFCFECHGASSSSIALRAGSSAYADSGGDHNEAAYDSSSAHGVAILAEHSDPSLECIACHSQHGSTADYLLDYRANGGYEDGAALCFACHSSSSTETTVAAGYGAPFAWNDRDVEAQFALTSTHPTETTASGRSLTCANCHNSHYVGEGGSTAWDTARFSDPSDTQATPASTTGFCLECHDGAPPAPTMTDTTVVPYTIGLSAQSAPYFTGWDKSAFTSGGHYTTTGTTALCEHCHDPHSSSYARLAAWTQPDGATSLNAGSRENATAGYAQEQNLCYQCHGDGATSLDGGVIAQQASGAKDVISKATATYGHDPSAWTGLHADTESAGDLGSSNRHAECADCHDPHEAKLVGGTATQDTVDVSLAGGALYGVFGAVPTYASENWTAASSFTASEIDGDATDFEAYLCMKCHSSNTTQLSSVTRNSQTYTPTDVSLDFNPGNYSSHNVLGQSVGGWNTFDVVPDSGGGTVTVTWPLPTVNVFVSGYDWNTKLTCTSCHTNEATPSTEAKGPHGSGVEWALDPAYSGDWRTAGLSSGSANGMAYSDGTAATDIICAKCHDLYGTSSGEDGWSNTAHNKSGHWVTHRDPKYCTNCHSGIPHGMSRPRMIGYTDDTAPYGSSNGGSSYGLVEIAASSRSLNSGAVTWGCSHCKTSSGRHPSDISASWP